jgi:hypothetical protein
VAEGAASTAAEAAYLEGFLYKTGAVNKGWRRRWVVLHWDPAVPLQCMMHRPRVEARRRACLVRDPPRPVRPVEWLRGRTPRLRTSAHSRRSVDACDRHKAHAESRGASALSSTTTRYHRIGLGLTTGASTPLKPAGVLPLAECTLSVPPTDGAGAGARVHSFVVHAPSRAYTFAADSAVELQRWTGTLARLIPTSTAGREEQGGGGGAAGGAAGGGEGAAGGGRARASSSVQGVHQGWSAEERHEMTWQVTKVRGAASPGTSPPRRCRHRPRPRPHPGLRPRPRPLNAARFIGGHEQVEPQPQGASARAQPAHRDARHRAARALVRRAPPHPRLSP